MNKKGVGDNNLLYRGIGKEHFGIWAKILPF